MLRLPAWALCCCFVVADGLLGCDTTCEKENGEARLYESGRTSPSCLSYETGGFDEPYVYFGPGRRVLLPHGLGQTPNDVQSYVAFVQDALLPQGENGNTAESAGNQVIIERVDEEFVQVRNDTCEHFWLRLVVEVFEPSDSCLAAQEPATGGAAGAGG